MTETQTKQAGWSDILFGEYAAFSAILGTGIALEASNLYVTATMLPLIVSDIGGHSFYAWNTVLFTIFAILSASVTGRILQARGARFSFALACVIFMFGCLISAASPSMPVLLAGRAVQGAGGGVLFTLCYSVIVKVYPEPLWPRAMALLSGTWGIATMFGPALGGMFAEFGHWRLGFLTIAVLTVLYAIFAVRVLPPEECEPEESPPVPLMQLVLLCLAVLVVSVGSLSDNLVFAGGAVLVAVFVLALMIRTERSGGMRLFPTGTFDPNNPLFLCFAIMTLLIFVVNAEFFMPYYLQKLHGVTPLLSGYISALMAIGWALSEVYCSRYADTAADRAIIAGPALTLSGLLILALVTPLAESAGLSLNVVMGAALFLSGIGIGAGWPHISAYALKFTQDAEKSLAGSALSTIQMFSVAFGASVSGLVVNLAGFKTQESAAVATSSFWLFLTFVVAAGLALFCAIRLAATRPK